RVRSHADPHFSELMRLQQFDVAKEAASLEQDAASAINQQATGRGHRDPARGAIEELHAQLVLERLDAAAQRRLAEMDPSRGAGKAALLRQRDEMGEPARIDLMHGLQHSDKEIALELLRYTTSNGQKHADGAGSARSR